MCRSSHPHHSWLRCHKQRLHKAKHGAVAVNPGQWIGNRAPGSWATTWGSDDDK